MLQVKFSAQGGISDSLLDAGSTGAQRDFARKLFNQRNMSALGIFGIKTVKDRTNKAIGSNDSAMPPLSGKTSAVFVNGKFVRQRLGYAGWKAAHGLNPIRDLIGTGKDGGHMWDNLTVRQTTDRSVTMAFTARKARIKALANEQRAPWFSFSPADQVAIVKYAQKIFNANVEIMARQMRPVRRAA